jgi:mono/diheme cytochrome c family protein
MIRKSRLVGGSVVCLIQFAALAADTPQKEVTFSRDIAPILQRACQNCHRPGSIAPMPLLTYKDARPWARSIKEKVATRVMPPWHIDHNVGVSKFKDDPSLSEAEIAAIVSWVDHGAPEGNAADMPPLRQFTDLDQWQWRGRYRHLHAQSVCAKSQGRR